MPDNPVSEVRRPYRVMLRYGPWGLAVVGLLMICGGVLLKRPDAVLIALIIVGAGALVAGVLLPRIQGPVELGTRGLKTTVQGIDRDELRTVLEAAQAAAEKTAEEVIGDGTDDDKDELVKHQMLYLLRFLDEALSETPRAEIISKMRHPSSRPYGLLVKYPEVYAAYEDLIARAVRRIPE